MMIDVTCPTCVVDYEVTDWLVKGQNIECPACNFSISCKDWMAKVGAMPSDVYWIRKAGALNLLTGQLTFYPLARPKFPWVMSTAHSTAGVTPKPVLLCKHCGRANSHTKSCPLWSPYCKEPS